MKSKIIGAVSLILMFCALNAHASCWLTVAQTKCKHVMDARGGYLPCLIENGAGKADTPEICAQAKALTAKPAKSMPATVKETLAPRQIASCSEEIKSKQIESQSWTGNVNDISARLGQFQKSLFEGRCAGHPEAQTYIAGANKMIGYGGNAAGSGGSSLPPRASARSVSGSGSADRSRSASGSASSEVRDYPEPDRNECIKVVENTRGEQCGQATSFSVVVKNICPAKIRMNLCLWDTKHNQWQCGSSAGRAGEKNFDTVLQYVCKSDGRYIYAGCSEQAQKGRFGNGNCGGNPNKAGKHSLISN